MFWFGLLIFMGLVKVARVNLYWRADGQCTFPPLQKMSLKRFEQLKRYFHLSPPNLTPSRKGNWYDEVEPFGRALRNPSCRWSSHTIKIKNKPIKQGYKLFALCWRGFTYSFLYSSRTKKIGEVKKLAKPLINFLDGNSTCTNPPLPNPSI